MIDGKLIMTKALYSMSSELEGVVKESITDCADDLLRVATERAPVKSKTLEQSGTKTPVSKSGGALVSQVSFRARKKSFNYAVKMDRMNYKLGDKSIQKSKRGVRSVFANQTMKVGTGYLTDTAEKCREGYVKHVQDKVGEEIKRLGFKK